MGQLKAGETVTLDSGAVVSDTFAVNFQLSFLILETVCS